MPSYTITVTDEEDAAIKWSTLEYATANPDTPGMTPTQFFQGAVQINVLDSMTDTYKRSTISVSGMVTAFDAATPEVQNQVLDVSFNGNSPSTQAHIADLLGMGDGTTEPTGVVLTSPESAASA